MSLLGTLLRPKSFPPPSTIAGACANASRRRGRARREEDCPRLRSVDDSVGGRRRRQEGRAREKSFEDVFIQSLVTASACRTCSTSRTTARTTSFSTKNYIRHRSFAGPRRAFSTARQDSQAGTAVQAIEEDQEPSRKQYEDLVNTYDARTLRPTKSKLPPEHYRLAPRLALTPEQEDRSPHAKRHILPPIDEDHKNKLEWLKKLLLNPPGYRLQKTWRVYEDLPTPRLRYISDKYVKKLLQHLAWVEKRGPESSQRYFVLLEEALGERVAIGAVNWNTAITFAGRWVRKTTAEDVKAAIEMWLRMEREGGEPANNVTFNILFDVAVKAGRFALADTIYGEMDRRGLMLNRYFRTSKIYYAGRRGDAENVRAAFRELVAAGEIVDTAVMNCVILSLVRCGEPASAEQIMDKMKLLHEQKFGIASLEDWRDRKMMGRHLDKQAQELRAENNIHLESYFGSPYSNDDKKEEIQRTAPIAPDEFTYRILIHWHASVSGNLDKIRTYLDEIKEAGYKIQHNVYFNLFKGFYKHGGYAFTAWNRRSLEEYWKDFVDGITSDATEKAMAISLNKNADKPTAAAESYTIYPLEPFDSSEIETDTEPQAIDDDVGEDDDPAPSHLAPTKFRPGTVMAALAAFYKCAGAKRMLEVWDEVQRKWPGMGDADRRRIEVVVAEKMREASVYVD